MTRSEILAAADNMPRLQRNKAAQAWCGIADEFYRAVDALPKRKRLKSFEVHHRIERARDAFLLAFVSSKPMAECRDAAKPFLNV